MLQNTRYVPGFVKVSAFDAPARYRPAGGWIEGRIAATARTRFIAGAGIDQPEDRPVLGFRTRNRTLFGSTIIDLTPEVAVSLEYRWMTTRLRIDATSLRNHHFNAAIGVKF